MRRLLGFLLALALVVPGAAVARSGCGHSCPPEPVAVGRLLTAGGETGDTTTEGFDAATTAGVSYDAASARSGALGFAIGGGTLAWVSTSATNTTYYFRTYIKPTAIAGGTILAWRTGSVMAALSIDGATGKLGVSGSSLTAEALTNGAWSLVEASFVYTGGTTVTLGVRVDGGTVVSSVFTPGAAANFTNVRMSFPGGAAFDDMAINDSAGASQNTWPGAAKVVLLLPVTDSATGTGWTLGTGTAPAGAGHGSLDNTPPTGVADLAVGSDPKQMRNASANANVNVDMTMTTYTAAGIAAIDTINVIDPITATGAPVVTSAKAGTVGVVSNPAIANVALGAGGTAGAFWSGVTAGTYPTGWKVSHGTVTYAPSVTLGTAPVMRVTQVTSSTRIAMVCFMGMYVDYTPGVPAQVPYVNPMPPILAQ